MVCASKLPAKCKWSTYVQPHITADVNPIGEMTVEHMLQPMFWLQRINVISTHFYWFRNCSVNRPAFFSRIAMITTASRFWGSLSTSQLYLDNALIRKRVDTQWASSLSFFHNRLLNAFNGISFSTIFPYTRQFDSFCRHRFQIIS